MTRNLPPLDNYNGWADFWRYDVGVNVIPADTKKKAIYEKWSQWQDSPIPEELHNKWKKKGAFSKGIAIIPGRVCHNKEKQGLYFTFLDADKSKAIEQLCTRNGKTVSLQEMSRKFIIEQHNDDLNRAHVYFYSSIPFPQKTPDPVLGLEVKGLGKHGIAFCSPSIHSQGQPYEIIGTTDPPITLTVDQANEFIQHIDTICKNNGIEYLSKHYENVIFDSDTKIYEGTRHSSLIRITDHLLFKHLDNGSKTEEQIKQMVKDINNTRCIPSPLPDREIEEIFNDALDYVSKRKQAEREEEREYQQPNGDDDTSSSDTSAANPDFGKTINAELKGNVFYIIKQKPPKFIIAYNNIKMLIESSIKTYDKTVFDKNGQEEVQKVKSLNQNKLYLTCIPVSIIKHKNPLSFLETTAKYTIAFVDSVGNHFTFKYKTLSEIIAGLRDNGYVQSDGTEGALGVMILAFTKNKLLTENYDMEYTGFFFDDNAKKIIASNMEIKNEISIGRLKEALKVIEEAAAKYYTNPDRLDLLATSIVWGMVAPISFLFKSNIYYLNWLHFWGSPNTTKSNTGIFILAIDGHHKDSKYVRNISNIDTIARLGEEVSKTTFPKLVDEVDLNEQNSKYLINLLKSAISSKIVRSKFRPNGSSAVDIPALSPLILTSNPPPPLWDSAYMKRVIDRYFDRSETKKEDDPIAVAFRQFLATELDKLYHLGDFRNWYVMNHQEDLIISAIHDEEKITSLLDLGTRLLTAAYEYAGLSMPDWFNKRLPQNQLENSFTDNKAAIKNAFETLINVNLKNFIRFDILEQFPVAVSDRVALLLKDNKLPFMKLDRTKTNVMINTGILPELYRYGVTREQLPNLKALADELNGSYARNERGQIVKVAWPKPIMEYFDAIDDE